VTALSKKIQIQNACSLQGLFCYARLRDRSGMLSKKEVQERWCCRLWEFVYCACGCDQYYSCYRYKKHEQANKNWIEHRQPAEVLENNSFQIKQYTFNSGTLGGNSNNKYSTWLSQIVDSFLQDKYNISTLQEIAGTLQAYVKQGVAKSGFTVFGGKEDGATGRDASTAVIYNPSVYSVERVNIRAQLPRARALIFTLKENPRIRFLYIAVHLAKVSNVKSATELTTLLDIINEWKTTVPLIFISGDWNCSRSNNQDVNNCFNNLQEHGRFAFKDGITTAKSKGQTIDRMYFTTYSSALTCYVVDHSLLDNTEAYTQLVTSDPGITHKPIAVTYSIHY
jgi:hypothetical protein